MTSIAELLLSRGERFGDRQWSDDEGSVPLRKLVCWGAGIAADLASRGLAPGDRVALIGRSSLRFLAWWYGLQLGGFEAALLNPTYPRALRAEMLEDLQPSLVVDLDEEPEAPVETSWSAAVGSAWPGLDRRPLDIAGYMATSGTSGKPKLCAQSQAYFLRLGRFVADRLCISPDDAVFTCLPLFHINPLGYAVLGGLCGGARVVVGRFSASRYWDTVREHDVTVLVLHAPPVEILKRTPVEASKGHRVRLAFLADAEFQEMFDIPLAVSAYGSTEAAGITHTWLWRIGESASTPGGNARYAGSAREGIKWRLAEDGEILVRECEAGTLISGYVRAGRLEPLKTLPGGWFSSGDFGLEDEGRLVFLERKQEAIRVKGEYVPISFVETRFAALDAIEDIALWRRDSVLVDHEVVLYVVARGGLDRDQLTAVADQLPAYMRPVEVHRVSAIPRDETVGKVQRRALANLPVLQQLELA